MKLSLEGNAGYTIHGYEADSVQISRPAAGGGPPLIETLSQSFVIARDILQREWSPQNIDALTALHLEPLLACEPELVILGSGRRIRFPGAELMGAFARAGIGVEVMDTGAACRTFNILSSEGRYVVAGLILGDEGDSAAR